MLSLVPGGLGFGTWTSSPARAGNGVSDDNMLHARRHHWRAFETDDPGVTMFISLSTASALLEIGVVTDDDGIAVIHAMPARRKFLQGWRMP